MAETANTIYLKDKDKNIILPATDWSVVNNKPNNLATTDQLPQDTGWQKGDLLNGTTGLFKYRQIGKILFLYASIRDYPVAADSGASSADGACIGFTAYPNSVVTGEVADWVSVDGNAKAQVGFLLTKGVMKVYRVEGSKSVIRLYHSFVVD